MLIYDIIIVMGSAVALQALQYGDEAVRVRATLARYPDANAEIDLFPIGYITDKTKCTHDSSTSFLVNSRILLGLSSAR